MPRQVVLALTTRSSSRAFPCRTHPGRFLAVTVQIPSIPWIVPPFQKRLQWKAPLPLLRPSEEPELRYQCAFDRSRDQKKPPTESWPPDLPLKDTTWPPSANDRPRSRSHSAFFHSWHHRCHGNPLWTSSGRDVAKWGFLYIGSWVHGWLGKLEITIYIYIICWKESKSENFQQKTNFHLGWSFCVFFCLFLLYFVSVNSILPSRTRWSFVLGVGCYGMFPYHGSSRCVFRWIAMGVVEYDLDFLLHICIKQYIYIAIYIL